MAERLRQPGERPEERLAFLKEPQQAIDDRRGKRAAHQRMLPRAGALEERHSFGK